MLNFDVLETGLVLVSATHFVYEKYFFCYMLLTDQTSFSDCLYLLRYLAICVL